MSSISRSLAVGDKWLKDVDHKWILCKLVNTCILHHYFYYHYTCTFLTGVCSFIDRYFVLARSDPNARTGNAFTAFVVDRDTPGITPGRKVHYELIVLCFVIFFCINCL